MVTMASKKHRPSDPARGHVLSERFADRDLVDRIFDYIVEQLPALADRAGEVKAAIREEFQGEEHYIRARPRGQLVTEVMSIFNGRNAREVARRLNISRATVYRVIKQAGPDPK